MKLSYKTWGIVRKSRLAKRIPVWLFSILISVCFAGVPAHADYAGLVALLQSNPDLGSFNLTANLSVGFSNGLFTATGDTTGYTPPAGGDPLSVTDITGGFSPGSFSLSAIIKTNGVLQSGSLTISGAVDDLSIPAGPLLSGEITTFGFLANSSPNPDEFVFMFNVTGGSLAADYGATGGTLLHPGNTTFNGSFLVDFSNDGTGSADTVRAIPEPSSALLVVMSLLGLCGVVRRVSLRKC